MRYLLLIFFTSMTQQSFAAQGSYVIDYAPSIDRDYLVFEFFDVKNAEKMICCYSRTPNQHLKIKIYREAASDKEVQGIPAEGERVQSIMLAYRLWRSDGPRIYFRNDVVSRQSDPAYIRTELLYLQIEEGTFERATRDAMENLRSAGSHCTIS